MDTPLCTAEPKPTMMGLIHNRLGTTTSVEQFSLVIPIKENDVILGLRTLRTLFTNPVTEIKTIRHPNEKLASTQTGTEIETQKDSTTRADQITLGTTDTTNVSELSITSVLDQRTHSLQ